eukprot:235257-Rhodomonas_salina.1
MEKLRYSSKLKLSAVTAHRYRNLLWHVSLRNLFPTYSQSLSISAFHRDRHSIFRRDCKAQEPKGYSLFSIHTDCQNTLASLIKLVGGMLQEQQKAPSGPCQVIPVIPLCALDVLTGTNRVWLSHRRAQSPSKARIRM